MIVLSATTDKIQIVLSGNVATSQLNCVASWRDITATPTYVAGRSVANSNNTTDVDLVASPAASTQRVIDLICITNTDTAAATVTIKYDANGTDYRLYRATVEAGGTIVYTDDDGWSVCNAAGARQTVGTPGANGANGANGSLAVTEVEIDFTATPMREKSFTITDSGISPSSKIIVNQSGAAATGQDADENEMTILAMNAVPGTGQFTLNTICLTGHAGGKFKINYQYS